MISTTGAVPRAALALAGRGHSMAAMLQLALLATALGGSGGEPERELEAWLAQAGLEPQHNAAGCAAALQAAGHEDGASAAAAVARGELDGASLKEAGLNMRERKRLLAVLEGAAQEAAMAGETAVGEAIETGLEQASQLGFALNFSAARQGFEAVGAAAAAIDGGLNAVDALIRVAEGIAQLGDTGAAARWARTAAEKLANLDQAAGGQAHSKRSKKHRRREATAAALARAEATAACGDPKAWGPSHAAVQAVVTAATQQPLDYDFGLWASERLAMQFESQHHGIDALLRVARLRAPRTPDEIRRIRTALHLLENSPGRQAEARALASEFPTLRTVDLESALIGQSLYRWQPAATPQPTRVDGLAVETVSAAPGVFALDGFASTAECEHLIALGTPRLAASKEASAATSSESKSAKKRTSASAFGINFATNDEVVRRVLQRAATVLNVEGARPTDFDAQLVKYGVGGHYLFHHDTVSPKLERYVTMLLYLSDGRSSSCSSNQNEGQSSLNAGEFCGGETALPMAKPLRHAPARTFCSKACDVDRLNSATAGEADATTRNTTTLAVDCYRCLQHDDSDAAKRCSAASPGLVYRGAVGSLLFWYLLCAICYPAVHHLIYCRIPLLLKQLAALSAPPSTCMSTALCKVSNDPTPPVSHCLNNNNDRRSLSLQVQLWYRRSSRSPAPSQWLRCDSRREVCHEHVVLNPSHNAFVASVVR